MEKVQVTRYKTIDGKLYDKEADAVLREKYVMLVRFMEMYRISGDSTDVAQSLLPYLEELLAVLLTEHSGGERNFAIIYDWVATPITVGFLPHFLQAKTVAESISAGCTRVAIYKLVYERDFS